MKTMTYRGALFNGEDACEKEIENRIGAVPKVIFAMRSEVLERRELNKGTKWRVFNAMVVPMLLYGFEIWTVQKTAGKQVTGNGNEFFEESGGTHEAR